MSLHDHHLPFPFLPSPPPFRLSSNQGEGVFLFLQDKSARSLHLGLKIIWYLQASAEYCYKVAERERCVALWEACEVALVNSNPLIEELLREEDLEAMDRIRSHAIRKMKSRRSHTFSGGESRPAVKTASAGDDDDECDDVVDMDMDGDKKEGDGETEGDGSTSFEDQEDGDGSVSVDDMVVVSEEEIDGAESVTEQVTPPPTPAPMMEGGEGELQWTSEVSSPKSPPHLPDASIHLFVAKQARSDYFNSLLMMMSMYSDAGRTLAKVPRGNDSRKKKLHQILTVLDRHSV